MALPHLATQLRKTIHGHRFCRKQHFRATTSSTRGWCCTASTLKKFDALARVEGSTKPHFFREVANIRLLSSATVVWPCPKPPPPTPPSLISHRISVHKTIKETPEAANGMRPRSHFFTVILYLILLPVNTIWAERLHLSCCFSRFSFPR